MSPTASSVASSETVFLTWMRYFWFLKVFFKSRSQIWSLMRLICSFNPFYSAFSVTAPKVSPIMAMSMFMNTTEMMNVARRNMKMAKYLS